MKAGANGNASTIAADIQDDFQNGTPESQVVHDAAFVQDGSRNLVVIANKSDNDVVLVDANDGYRMREFAPSKNTESASGNRQVERAVGTPYVWINGGETSEMYLVGVSGGIDGARVAKAPKDVPDGKVVFVQKYARSAEEVETNMLRVEAMDYEDGEDDAKAIGAAALIIGCINLVGLVVLGVVFRWSAGKKSPLSAPARKTAEPSETKSLGSNLVA